MKFGIIMDVEDSRAIRHAEGRIANDYRTHRRSLWHQAVQKAEDADLDVAKTRRVKWSLNKEGDKFELGNQPAT